MTTAGSIFEYLTAKNPDIEHLPLSQNAVLNTSSPHYFTPRQLKDWDEFNFQTLEAVYEGCLIREARQKPCSLTSLPSILPKIDCQIKDEATTVHILTKWTHTIVVTALNDVQQAFNPCIWVPGTGKTSVDQNVLTGDAKKQRPKSKKRKLNPDAGAVSLPWEGDSRGISSTLEKLPKDYKTASKWKSSDIKEDNLLDENGEWRPGLRRKNKAMPIRQVYTYCVDNQCRYGCILTTSEAFVFRIKPRSTLSGSARNHGSLRMSLINNGLMEFVSIPWTNGRSGSPEEYKSLTVNLALWFLHILAGNRHQVDWSYCPLTFEELAECCASTSARTPAAPIADSSRAVSNTSQRPSNQEVGSRSSRKRKRAVENEDQIYWSFAQSQRSETQSLDRSTVQSTQSTQSGVLDKGPHVNRRMRGRSQNIHDDQAASSQKKGRPRRKLST